VSRVTTSKLVSQREGDPTLPRYGTDPVQACTWMKSVP